jgi:hypothetical protein
MVFKRKTHLEDLGIEGRIIIIVIIIIIIKYTKKK